MEHLKIASDNYVAFTFFIGTMAMMAASVFFFFDNQGTNDTCSNQQNSTYGYSHQTVIVQKIFHDAAKTKRCNDFWENNEKIENPHVNTHFLWRYAASKDGIGHGKDRSPCNAYHAHGDIEHVRLFNHVDRNQAQSTYDKAKSMGEFFYF